jgi:DNA-3-methyladenine glycosylase II
MAELARRDADLATLARRHGPPPLWDRPAGFQTLLLIILEQQVSLASARAAFERLREAADPLSPGRLLKLPDAQLRGIGFSRQKAGYARGLAEAMVSGAFDPARLADLSDQEARQTLMELRGIGAWTAEVYLLMALRRRDVWPVGDLALQVAVQEVKGLAERPDAGAMLALAEPWRPWRSVAARMLWQHYLSR